MCSVVEWTTQLTKPGVFLKYNLLPLRVKVVSCLSYVHNLEKTDFIFTLLTLSVNFVAECICSACNCLPCDCNSQIDYIRVT